MTKKLGKLYGITNSNRRDHWGKNRFNSSLPTSLACYMRDNGYDANYLSIDETLKIGTSYLPFEQVFNTESKKPYFEFESKYMPYQAYCYDDIKGIDLVIKDENDQSYLRPLEVKLTVVPDQTTFARPEEQWSPEMVVRPATTSYCALSIFHSLRDKKDEIAELFEPVGQNVNNWDNQHEMAGYGRQIIEILDEFQSTFFEYQKPFLLQPIWKTQGKSPFFAENAFDIFVWSDFALCRAFISNSLESYRRGEVQRMARATVRLFRAIFELSTKRKIRIEEIYKKMDFGTQTDKEFSMSGMFTKELIVSPNRSKPRLSYEVLSKLILDGGEKLLSPERRLDNSVYLASQHLFNKDMV